MFSCDGCAEVLKKNQVDAHASRCRRCYSVSCADCLVSFPGGTCVGPSRAEEPPLHDDPRLLQERCAVAVPNVLIKL